MSLLHLAKEMTQEYLPSLCRYPSSRCNKGPMKSWLHHLGKAPDPACPCGHTPQDGSHLTFSCPLHAEARNTLLGTRDSWEKLDEDVYIQHKEDPEVWYEATEEWFGYLFSVMTSAWIRSHLLPSHVIVSPSLFLRSIPGGQINLTPRCCT